jgi:hypothetical protein
MAWLIENDQKEDNFAEPISVMPLEQFAGWESRSCGLGVWYIQHRLIF